MTATLLPTRTGVSLSGNVYAFMKLIRVRNSFAEYTPFRFSPGMFWNFGSPAPEPTNTALYPSSNRSSSDTERPTTTFFSILTPIASTLSISCFTSRFGSRNSGMP